MSGDSGETVKRCPGCRSVMDPERAWWWTEHGATCSQGCARELTARVAALASPAARPAEPPGELLHAAREWIFRHSSQPDGDRWTDNPDHLDWAAQNLLVDLTPWLVGRETGRSAAGPTEPILAAEATVKRVEALVAFYDRHEYSSLDVDDLRRALDGTQ